MERRIQELKKVAIRIMDHTKAPDYLWYQCLQYASTLLNHTATRSLDWKTPLEVAFGLAPDISALLQYAFYEPIYYYDAEVSFPHSRELPGRFLGIAENVGDALTFQVLTDENRVICRSVMRSALDTINVNQRALLTDNVGDPEINLRLQNQIPYEHELETFANQNIHYSWEGIENVSTNMIENGENNNGVGSQILAIESAEAIMNRNSNGESILQTTRDIVGSKTLPEIDPLQLIGFNFVSSHNELEQRATVKQVTEDGNFIIQYIDGSEELANYNDIVNKFSQSEEDSAELYIFTDILDHKIENGKSILQIKWDNGEITWEPLQTIKECDPLTLAKYAHEKDLTEVPGWKWTKRYKNNPQKFIRMSKIYRSQKKASLKKYKFGVEVPADIEHALKLDDKNGDDMWKQAIEKEVDQVSDLNTFVIHESKATIPPEFGYIPIHFVFDVKFDGRRKARLVAGGHTTNPDTSEIYSGVVSIEHVRMALFLADLNDMDVIAADVGNAFLHGKTREKL